MRTEIKKHPLLFTVSLSLMVMACSSPTEPRTFNHNDYQPFVEHPGHDDPPPAVQAPPDRPTLPDLGDAHGECMYLLLNADDPCPEEPITWWVESR